MVWNWVAASIFLLMRYPLYACAVRIRSRQSFLHIHVRPFRAHGRTNGSRMVIVEWRLVLDLVPDGIDPLHGFVAEGPASDRVQCLLQLFNTAGADNEGVAVLILQWRVVSNPSVSQIGSRDLRDECQ